MKPNQWARHLGALLTALLLMLCAVCLVIPAASARPINGFGPSAYKNGATYGNGIYFAPYHITVYQTPSENSPVVEDLVWSHNGDSLSLYSRIQNRRINASSVFISFYPQNDVAMMAVLGDANNQWVEVVYDQRTQASGWVHLNIPIEPEMTASQSEAGKQTSATEVSSGKTAADESPELITQDGPRLDALPGSADNPAHFGTYQPWVSFMKYNAKAYGIYWLSGVTDYYRSLRTSDDDKAPFIKVTVIRDLRVRHIRGNWLLVEALDFQRNTPIGWVRWRDNNGNILVFPNIAQEKAPIITTAF